MAENSLNELSEVCFRVKLGSEVFYACNFDFPRQTAFPHKMYSCG